MPRLPPLGLVLGLGPPQLAQHQRPSLPITALCIASAAGERHHAPYPPPHTHTHCQQHVSSQAGAQAVLLRATV
jgi:hypothetical protein